jgi:hypothetical protein
VYTHSWLACSDRKNLHRQPKAVQEFDCQNEQHARQSFCRSRYDQRNIAKLKPAEPSHYGADEGESHTGGELGHPAASRLELGMLLLRFASLHSKAW